MLLTIAVCTWNRSALLRQALTHMTSLVVPAGIDLEILVINNNCTDDTDAVIAEFGGPLPLRRLFEAKPGQSNARNNAVEHSRGDYILWTDDDVLVDPNWVAGYVEAIRTWPNGVVFGGPILPAFAVEPPIWLTEAWAKVANVYATRDLGAEPLRFDGEARTPFGANFVVRTPEQRTVRYDPELGLRPGGSLRGEETDVVSRLLALGHGWWVPGASVRHYIPAERMTTRYIRSFCWGQGEYMAKTESPGNWPMWLGRPRWLWRQAISAEAAYRLHRVVAPATIWVHDLCAASTSWGRLFGTQRRS